MKILLSNAHLIEFGGSELVTVELAEEFALRGHAVTIFSPIIAPPLLPTINRHNITLTTTEPVDEIHTFDIVWSHHGHLLQLINTQNKKPHQTIISNVMSSYVRQEYPTYPAHFVDRLFCNSEETRQALPLEHRHKAELMQNPVPACTRGRALSNKKPIGLSISNHRPPELLEFMVAHADEIDFISMGKQTKNFTRLSPNKLREMNVDFVIANGKSVQMAMVAELPVFLYDHFSGPGWLTEDNFATAEHYNFSGRGFDKNPHVLKTILDFHKQKPIELWPERLKAFRLDLWLEDKKLV